MTLLKLALSSLGVACTVGSISFPVFAVPQSSSPVSLASRLGHSVTGSERLTDREKKISTSSVNEADVLPELDIDVASGSKNRIVSSFRWQSELLSNGHRLSDLNSPLRPSQF
ncbi:MAG: hypothetical protein AAF329_06995 [Cyanobacteria bacterium P01_A01_bin.17]